MPGRSLTRASRPLLRSSQDSARFGSMPRPSRETLMSASQRSQIGCVAASRTAFAESSPSGSVYRPKRNVCEPSDAEAPTRSPSALTANVVRREVRSGLLVSRTIAAIPLPVADVYRVDDSARLLQGLVDVLDVGLQILEPLVVAVVVEPRDLFEHLLLVRVDRARVLPDQLGVERQLGQVVPLIDLQRPTDVTDVDLLGLRNPDPGRVIRQHQPIGPRGILGERVCRVGSGR